MSGRISIEACKVWSFRTLYASCQWLVLWICVNEVFNVQFKSVFTVCGWNYNFMSMLYDLYQARLCVTTVVRTPTEPKCSQHTKLSTCPSVQKKAIVGWVQRAFFIKFFKHLFVTRAHQPFENPLIQGCSTPGHHFTKQLNLFLNGS
jgi:hypothetical protein